MCVCARACVCVCSGEAFQTVDDVWCLMIVMLELTLQYLCMDRNAIDKVCVRMNTGSICYTRHTHAIQLGDMQQNS